MTNSRSGNVEVFEQGSEACPGVTASLAASIEPFEQALFRVVKEIVETFIAASNTVIIPVRYSPQGGSPVQQPGTCFLWGLHNVVHPFPMGSARPSRSTMGVSDSLIAFSRPSCCWLGLPA